MPRLFSVAEPFDKAAQSRRTDVRRLPEPDPILPLIAHSIAGQCFVGWHTIASRDAVGSEFVVRKWTGACAQSAPLRIQFCWTLAAQCCTMRVAAHFFRYVILPAVSASNETDNARAGRANHDEAGVPLIGPRPTAKNARRFCLLSVPGPLRT